MKIMQLLTRMNTRNTKSLLLGTPVEFATPPGSSRDRVTAVALDGTIYLAWQQDNEEVFFMTLPPVRLRIATG